MKASYHQAVADAGGAAQQDAGDHADDDDAPADAHRGDEIVHHDDHDAGDYGGHRADRQIEAARGDHERRADGDDADEGGAREDVGDVVVGEEVLVERDTKQHEKRQRHQRPDGLEVQAEAPRRRCCRRLRR
jgi:hypothetical protein